MEPQRVSHQGMANSKRKKTRMSQNFLQKKLKRVVRNFNGLKDSSNDESSSAVTSTMLMIMMDEVSKYRCKKIQFTEISELLAQWCQHGKKARILPS